MPSISPQLPTQQGHRYMAAQGLYDANYEHDACGVAFVVDVHGLPSADLVAKGLTALRNLDHRGASGSGPRVRYGAAVLLQVPDAFLRSELRVPLPPKACYAVGLGILPPRADSRGPATYPI